MGVHSIRSPLHHHPQEEFLGKGVRQHIKTVIGAQLHSFTHYAFLTTYRLPTISYIYTGTRGSSVLHGGDHIGLLRYIAQPNVM